MISKTLFLSLLIAIIFIGCKKGNNAKPSKITFTSEMGGIRNWRGSHYYHADGVFYPTPIDESWALPDTSLALTIINDTAIQFWGNVYSYDRSDSVQKVHYFGGSYFYYNYNMGSGIAYFYDTDSIVYCRGDIHHTSTYHILQDIFHTY